MVLILLCEEVIEPTASAVTCVKNDRICDIILHLYPSDWCQITPLFPAPGGSSFLAVNLIAKQAQLLLS